MAARTDSFVARVERALDDGHLAQALGHARDGFVLKRRKALNDFPDFERCRDRAVEIRDHTLEHLDHYLLRYVDQVERMGAKVHWAPTAEDACAIILDICRDAGARIVTKGKSMVAEEIELNAALDAAGFERVETDLGEYIIQLAGETPSHIIAPAVHKTRDQISDLFHAHHAGPASRERLTAIPELVDEARRVLREKFLAADVGITGANFLVAENGVGVIVTNEGNGDLTATLPRVHIAVTGIEKVVPNMDDLGVLLRLLGRSATGQVMTSYTTLFCGPRRPGDPDGPDAMHVVLVDNGRSRMLGDPALRDMLRCIRCGACMNHCPVYTAIGGHAYGWVYPGPMGSILTAGLKGLDSEPDLPQACTLNGHCAEVCPVRIPLNDMMRDLRQRQFERGSGSKAQRLGIRLWGQLAARPRAYQSLSRLAVRLLAGLGGTRGHARSLPLLGAWFRAGRHLPTPQGRTFMDAWKKHGRK